MNCLGEAETNVVDVKSSGEIRRRLKRSTISRKSCLKWIATRIQFDSRVASL